MGNDPQGTATDRSADQVEIWLSPTDLADRLGISLGTIYHWHASGQGPLAHKLGKHLRFRPSDVETWLQRQRDRRSEEVA